MNKRGIKKLRSPKSLQKHSAVKKQKFKLISRILFLIASLQLFYIGYTVYRDNEEKIKSQTYINAYAARYATELYFEDTESLPKDTALFKENTFRFTIRNLEGKPMVYDYKIYMDTNGNKKIIERKELKLADKESKTIEITYRLFYPIEKSQVFVKLMDSMQNISFWIK